MNVRSVRESAPWTGASVVQTNVTSVSQAVSRRKGERWLLLISNVADTALADLSRASRGSHPWWGFLLVAPSLCLANDPLAVHPAMFLGWRGVCLMWAARALTCQDGSLAWLLTRCAGKKLVRFKNFEAVGITGMPSAMVASFSNPRYLKTSSQRSASWLMSLCSTQAPLSSPPPA